MKKDAIAIIILAILTFIFHAKLLFPPSLYLPVDFARDDLTYFNYPIGEFYAQSLKFHRLPLWNDQIFTGYPVLAESQVGTFYLPNMILFYFFPTPWAFNFSYILTFFIAASGIYFYCRFSKLSIASSILSSIAFAFSTYLVGHIVHFNLLQVASLTPWLFLSAEKLLSKGGTFNLSIFSFVFAQQIFAGFMQITVYTLGAILLLVIFRIIQKGGKVHFLLFLIAALLGLGLSAIQLIPTLELVNVSARSIKLPFEQFNFFPFKMKDLLFFIHPYLYGPFQGVFHENIPYLGILPLFLASFALLQIKKEKNILFFFILFILATLFSLGLLDFLIYLPIFSLFRLHERSLLLSVFSLALLAGFGLNSFSSKIIDKFNFLNFLVFAISGLLILTAFLNLYLLTSSYNKSIPIKVWLDPPVTTKFLKEGLNGDRVFSVGQRWYWGNVIKLFQNRQSSFADEDAYFLLEAKNLVEPNTNIIYDLASFDGYASIETKEFEDLKTLILDGIIENNESIVISKTSTKLLSLANVRYLISPKPVISDNLIEVFKYPDPNLHTTYKIYENNERTGRIFAVKKLEYIERSERIKSAVSETSFSPREKAFIQTNLPKMDFDNSVKIIPRYLGNQNLKLSVASKGKSFIVIADSFYPGWNAKIDGKETKIFLTNVNSRGILLPPGEHEISMDYRPKSLLIGVGISLLSIMIYIAILILRLNRKHR